MPPRYAYWTILVDGQPTAFRAAEPDELLPTLKRLQVKQPAAIMKWFQRGRLWESKEEAKDKLDQGYTVGPDGALVPPDAASGRGKGWRPGGEHKDPREKYQLAKKAKWQKFKQMVRSRPGHGPKDGETGGAPADDAESRDPLHEDPALDAVAFGDGGFEDVTAQYLADDDAPGTDSEAPASAKSDEAGPPATDWRGRPKPEGGAPTPKRAWSGDRPKPAWRDKPGGGDRGGARPTWTPRPDSRGPKPEWKARPDARGPKPEWRDRPSGDRPSGDRPGGGRPAGDRPWSDRPKPAWRDKPGGGARPAWTPRPDARGPKPEWRDRPSGDRSGGGRPDGDRPWTDRPKPAWRDKPGGADRGGARPAWTPRPDSRGPRPEWTPRPDARGPKPEWRDRPSGDRPPSARPGGGRPGGDRPGSDRPKPAWRDKPGGADRGGARPAWTPRPDSRGPKPEWTPRPDARGPKPEWRDRPGGDRPHGDRPGGDRTGGDRPSSDRPKPSWTPRPDARGPKPDWKKPGGGTGGNRPYAPKKKY